jgi:hypothetical protein
LKGREVLIIWGHNTNSYPIPSPALPLKGRNSGISFVKGKRRFPLTDGQKRFGILFELGQGVKFRKDLKTQKRSFVDHQGDSAHEERLKKFLHEGLLEENRPHVITY